MPELTRSSLHLLSRLPNEGWQSILHANPLKRTPTIHVAGKRSEFDRLLNFAERTPLRLIFRMTQRRYLVSWKWFRRQEISRDRIYVRALHREILGSFCDGRPKLRFRPATLAGQSLKRNR